MGTTVAAGYHAGLSGGRREGTTIAAGCSVGVSGGHPVGTTAAAGYNNIIGMSSGRPEGTTLERGYDVGTCTNFAIDFSGCNLPTDWDVSSTTLNINDDLHTTLGQKINMQCGRVLWGEGSSEATYMVDPPEGVRTNDAPANAFLKSVQTEEVGTGNHVINYSSLAYHCNVCVCINLRTLHRFS